MRRNTVLPALLLLLAGCTGPVSPPAEQATAPTSGAGAPAPSVSGSTDLGLRTFGVPALQPGQPCPTTPRQPWSGPGVAAAVLGAGPVYPVADYFDEGTVLTLRDDDRQPDGTYAKKVRWIGNAYVGPVLIRIHRLDGPGTGLVRFSDWGQPRDGGYYADLPTATSDLPATTTVSGPGCYAYQVDGDTFSTTVVFGAAAG